MQTRSGNRREAEADEDGPSSARTPSDPATGPVSPNGGRMSTQDDDGQSRSGTPVLFAGDDLGTSMEPPRESAATRAMVLEALQDSLPSIVDTIIAAVMSKREAATTVAREGSAEEATSAPPLRLPNGSRCPHGPSPLPPDGVPHASDEDDVGAGRQRRQEPLERTDRTSSALEQTIVCGGSKPQDPRPETTSHVLTPPSVMLDSLRRRTFMDKFCSGSEMPAEMWIAVFEQATRGVSDDSRIELLLSYLTKDALRWYAQFVTPIATTATWDTVRRLFTDKFARQPVSPLIAAMRRKLQPKETVQAYFDEKTRLLELANQTQETMVALLTDGVPESYRDVLCGARPKTIADWLDVAQQFQATRQADRSDGKPVHVVGIDKHRPSGTRMADKSSTDKPPSSPCPRCLAYGHTEYHWSKTCSRPFIPELPKRTTTQPPRGATAVPLNGNSGQHTA